MKYHNSKKSAGGLTLAKLIEAAKLLDAASADVVLSYQPEEMTAFYAAMIAATTPVTHPLIDAQFIAPRYCGPRTIYATVFDRRLVSTVRTGSAKMAFVSEYSAPTLCPYETAIFNRDGECVERRHYLTHAEAKRGHWAVCLVHLQSQ